MTHVERGFRRLGVFLAAPFVVIAVLFFGYFKLFQPPPPAWELKSGGTEITRPEKDQTALYWAAGFAATGGLVWITFAGLGWVIAGFKRN